MLTCTDKVTDYIDSLGLIKVYKGLEFSALRHSSTFFYRKRRRERVELDAVAEANAIKRYNVKVIKLKMDEERARCFVSSCCKLESRVGC